MRAKAVSGNPDLPDFDEEGNPILVNQSYIYHPDYYGLILRKNEKDLQFFLREAQKMWEPYGAEWKSGHFDFPSGARIDAGHMADENAWHKYIGNEYQRVFIDEAALIPEYGPIEEIRSGMRTPLEKTLRIQIVYASNYGGKGSSWLIARFMEVRDKNGDLIPHDNVIEEEVIHPFTGEKIIRQRVWMFSTVNDNPIMRTSGYAAELANLTDPKRRRAYFLGLWDSFQGSYFVDCYRPNGPIHENSEPENANHVIPASSVKLQPWWHRSIGMDWGYAHESSIVWGCQEPNGHFYIYREIVLSHADPIQLGYEIALASRLELQSSTNKSMIMHLSHDAFSTRAGAKTIAELVYAGMVRVLGPDAVHLPDIMIKDIKEAFLSEAYTLDAQKRRDRAIEAIENQKRIGITIRKAEKANVIGWQHCREIMRWRSIGTGVTQFEPEVFQRLLIEDAQSAIEYSNLYRDKRAEVLPKLQIMDNCPRLIQALGRLQHEDNTEEVSKDHFVGRDSCDSFHYLALGARDENPPEPFEHRREQELERIYRQHPDLSFNQLVHVNRMIEADWENHDKTPAPFTPANGYRGRKLLRQGRIKSELDALDIHRGV